MQHAVVAKAIIYSYHLFYLISTLMLEKPVKHFETDEKISSEIYESIIL